MSTHHVRSIPNLVRLSAFQVIAVAILTAFLLSFIYGFVHHYQQKRLHIQQLADVLSDIASTVDGANLAARNIGMILEEDSSIQSIVFYPSDHPAVALKQPEIEANKNDWYISLFINTISFNSAVTNSHINDINKRSIFNENEQQLSKVLSSNNRKVNTNTDNSLESNAVIGYINITLDLNKLRLEWVLKNIWLWLATVAFTVSCMIFIMRKLNWSTKDITELAKVCDIVVDSPELRELPSVQQNFDFQELSRIRLAIITLFNRLKITEKKLDAIAAFEVQLHNKDVSLSMQRANFQSMITHELKTSLNAISGGIQLLNPRTLNEEQKDILAIIRQGSEHLDNTLEQIIQLNKIEKGQVSISLSDFNPLQLLADLLSEFEPTAKQKGLELTSRVKHIDYMLQGDVDKIKQIISTLIENAIKFTLSGQVIVESQLNYFHQSIRWQIKVTDTGVGIDDKYIDDLFTAFFQVDSSHTREYSGLGVGLTVVNQIAQLIGASIEVSSKLDIGSEFTVTIPLRNAYQNQRHFSFTGLNFAYYYHEQTGFIVEELQRLGASVTCHQYGLSVIEQLTMTTVDMIMIAEEVSPEKAAQLARYIREQESTHRALLVYWYPEQNTPNLSSFEHGLKAVGVDFLHSTTRDSKEFYNLLKQWLAYA